MILESEWGRSPLTVDDLVPTVLLRFRLGRTHVGTPTLDVCRDTWKSVKHAADRDPRWTRELRKQTLAAAIWLHHENRAEYHAVMSGRIA
jgi:hypothetical protein